MKTNNLSLHELRQLVNQNIIPREDKRYQYLLKRAFNKKLPKQKEPFIIQYYRNFIEATRNYFDKPEKLAFRLQCVIKTIKELDNLKYFEEIYSKDYRPDIKKLTIEGTNKLKPFPIRLSSIKTLAERRGWLLFLKRVIETRQIPTEINSVAFTIQKPKTIKIEPLCAPVVTGIAEIDKNISKIKELLGQGMVLEDALGEVGISSEIVGRLADYEGLTEEGMIVYQKIIS